MTRRIELSEWSSTIVPMGSLGPDELLLFAQINDEAKSGLGLKWLPGRRLEITATSWIGVVRLGDITLSIRPKFAGNELGVIKMLQYASGLDRARSLSTQHLLDTTGHNLFDLVCQLFLNQASSLIHDGLIHDYRQEENSLHALRGSLRYREQATRRFGQLDVLECRYDDFDADVIENQLLAATLQLVARVSNDQMIRRQARRLGGALVGVADPGPTDPDYYEQRLSYNRRNDHYREAHNLALVLLRNLGVDDLYKDGPTSSYSFLLNMNDLFERFATRLLSESLKSSRWRALAQHSFKKTMTNGLSGKQLGGISPDIVLTDGRCFASFDCKYKLYENKTFSTPDVYQSFFYAWALADEDGLPGQGEHLHAGILYPSKRNRVGPQVNANNIAGTTGATITGYGLDLVAILAELDGGIDLEHPSFAILRQVVETVDVARV